MEVYFNHHKTLFLRRNQARLMKELYNRVMYRIPAGQFDYYLGEIERVALMRHHPYISGVESCFEPATLNDYLGNIRFVDADAVVAKSDLLDDLLNKYITCLYHVMNIPANNNNEDIVNFVNSAPVRHHTLYMHHVRPPQGNISSMLGQFMAFPGPPDCSHCDICVRLTTDIFPFISRFKLSIMEGKLPDVCIMQRHTTTAPSVPSSDIIHDD